MSVRLYWNNFEDANVEIIGQATDNANTIVNVHQTGNDGDELLKENEIKGVAQGFFVKLEISFRKNFRNFRFNFFFENFEKLLKFREYNCPCKNEKKEKITFAMK